MAVDKNELDKLMTNAGLGARSKKKMHEANNAETSATPAARPRGHGAAQPVKVVIDEL